MNIQEHIKTEDLIISSAGFGLLRKGLLENMGQQRAKKFLIRFGSQLGTSKAKELMQQSTSIEELLAEAPKIHTMLKHVSKVEVFGSSLSLRNKEQPPEEIWGIWYDSYEAQLHLKNHGLSHECTCYTLSGFASGYLSTIHGMDIYVYEVTCRAKGDEHCTFKVKTREECERLKIDLDIYDDFTIKDELEFTYDKLYEQKALLDKVTNYHSKLTDAILQQNDINHILKTAHNILNIPIYITNAQGMHMYSFGLNAEQLTALEKKAAYFRQISKSSVAKIQQLDLITTPIYLDNVIYATVSFIYLDNFKNDNDFLFLERLSVVAGLYYLNDKVRFETTERLKISFLDRLIHGQFTNKSEMLRHSQYIKPAISDPYCIVSIKYQISTQQIKPFDIYNQIFQLARLLNLFQVNGLISSKDDHLIVLAYNVPDQSLFLNYFQQIMNELQKINTDVQYKVGISHYFNQLQNFETYIKQAEQAMYFPRKQLVTHFNDLGLLGAIIGQMDVYQLKEVAFKELSGLLGTDDKERELLYTLYVFLKNNGKLEKTMHDLSLSIGGIKYRISKIEKILNKDLKDALVTSYILLLIESLLILNEIHFE